MSKVVIIKPIELIFKCFPKITNDPNKIWAIATIDKEKTGKGTSFAITTSKFSEKKNAFAIPGNKKYIPINTLPMEYKLNDIYCDNNYPDSALGQTNGTCCCGLNTLGPWAGYAFSAAAISSLLRYSLGTSLKTSKPLLISVP